MSDECLQQLYAWLAQIPPGHVVTYGQLAKLIGRPNGARWVGRQLGRLPSGSTLSWHRVLNARGCSSLPLDRGVRTDNCDCCSARGWLSSTAACRSRAFNGIHTASDGDVRAIRAPVRQPISAGSVASR